jgi:histidinol-phosphate aminotransferase
MDANESPFQIPLEIRAQLASELLNGNAYHLYPDSDANVLRDKLADSLSVSRENILIGNGSDELIQIVTNAFAGRGDAVLYPTPSFSMYAFYAKVAGAIPVEYSLDAKFRYNIAEIEKAVGDYGPAVLHICSPNNPTGSILPVSDILKVARKFDGIVVVDEAYYEFYGESVVKYIDTYPNLVVLRTFSKAMGMAGLRVGYLICNKNLASEIHKVKPPYNVNSFSQRAAELVLQHANIRKERVTEILEAREWLYQALDGLRGVEPYPTKANFILMKVKNGAAVYKGLLEKGILVRHYNGDPLLNNHLRVTIGRMEDNKYFLQSLAEILGDMEEW